MTPPAPTVPVAPTTPTPATRPAAPVPAARPAPATQQQRTVDDVRRSLAEEGRAAAKQAARTDTGLPPNALTPFERPRTGYNAGQPAPGMVPEMTTVTVDGVPQQVRKEGSFVPAQQQRQQTPIQINTDGHFHPVVRINGVQLTMLADTGASSVSLTAKDAQKIGTNLQTLQFTGKSITANGTVPRASLLLQEVKIGGIILRNVQASCCVSGSESLLGMSVLGQLNIRIADGLMYLAPK